MTTTINAGAEKTLYIGKQGENLATRVDFGAFAADCLATFGAGTLTLVHERAEDLAPYPIMPVDGRYWDVTSADLQYAGTGYIEATYVVGDVVKKSLRWKTVTLSALGEVVEPPEAWLAYIERVTQLVDSVQNMTVSATQTEIPTVKKSMDAEGRVHLTFGLVQGEAGFSPVVKLTPAPDGVNISVKDATSESTQLIKHGLPGKDGVNPTLKLERTENGVRMTATDKEGITSQVVKDGKDGKNGADGKDGSDADVTSENIKAALGYTPANDAETVKNASFETLKTTVAGKLDKPVNEPWTGAVPVYDDGALKWHTSVYSVNGQTGNVELPTVDPSIERRLTNLEYAAQGVLYREDVSESEDYEKPIAPDVMPYGLLDSIGGKTIVMNQLVGDSYPEPFEGEVYEQTIPEKVKSVSVKAWGGKSQVWQQCVNINDFITTLATTLNVINDETFIIKSIMNNLTSKGVFVKKKIYNNHLYYASAYITGDGINKARLFLTRAGGAGILTSFANWEEVNATDRIKHVMFGRSTEDISPTNAEGLSVRLNNATPIDGYVTVDNFIAFDLTAMGWDDITSVDDPRITWIEQYAQAHPEYSAGKIISADVESVTVKTADDSVSVVRTIPEAVRALDGYGWSAGTARNYIERTEDGKWLYHKQVGAVDLSALTWSYVSANKYWVGQCDGVKLRSGIIAEKYRYTPGSLNINTEPYRITDWYANDNRFDVKTEGVDSNDSKPTGIAYYTLSNPVVTDITALMGTALNGIEVEPGGTLTFVQSGSTNLTVPVTETLNLGEWQQPLDTTHRYSVNGSLLTGAANTEVTGGTDYIIDLTRAGVDTPEAFPEPYYAPNPGELISKAHEAVVSRGLNLNSTTPVADIIRKYFPDGMRNAGAVKDELDIENGVAVKRVGSVDMGALTWGYYEPANRFAASIIPDFVKKNVNESIKVMASDIYTVTEKIWWISPTDMGICANNGQTIIRDNSANGHSAILKEKLQGVRLYYELADYITTPIDPADLEALRTLHVEAGGSLTFTDTNAGFRIPCGNKETFLVKTGGVSA